MGIAAVCFAHVSMSHLMRRDHLYREHRFHFIAGLYPVYRR
jgi:hypothetical protein